MARRWPQVGAEDFEQPCVPVGRIGHAGEAAVESVRAPRPRDHVTSIREIIRGGEARPAPDANESIDSIGGEIRQRVHPVLVHDRGARSDDADERVIRDDVRVLELELGSGARRRGHEVTAGVQGFAREVL